MEVTLSKEAKKAYRIFSWLRERFPNADVCTLRHLSVYIARTNDEFDINRDIQIKSSKGVCELLLTNGSEIRFVDNSDDPLFFIVENEDKDVYMTLYVAKQECYNLSTAFAHGTVGYRDWKYEIGSEDYESGNCFIKVYYKNELIEDATSDFNAIVEHDIGLDCIDGLGHLTDIMLKVNLLYNNLRSIQNNKLVRKK